MFRLRSRPSITSRALFPFVATSLLVAGWIAGCSDLGDPIGTSDPTNDGFPTSDAQIDELVPMRTVESDSVRVNGSGFGDDSSGASFRFPGTAGDTVEAVVLSWSDTQIVVLVPAGTGSGATHFERDGQGVNGPRFETAPRRYTYSGDLVPLFGTWGCASCHGGSGNLFVQPWESLMAGTSDHGPVVVPRRSASSLLVQRLLPQTPVSQRMPQGGSYLDDATIRIVADWIDQGARND